MEPILDCQECRSQLFCIVHPWYGYAMAGKGRIGDAQLELEHEHKIYKQIWSCLVAQHQKQGLVTHHHSLPILDQLELIGQTDTDTDTKAQVKGVHLQVPVSFGIVTPTPEFDDVMYPMWPVGGQFEKGNICDTLLLLLYHGLSLLDMDPHVMAEEHLLKAGLGLDDLHDWCKHALIHVGVCHFDLAKQNMLWCCQLEVVVLIDFEYASISPFCF